MARKKNTTPAETTEVEKEVVFDPEPLPGDDITTSGADEVDLTPVSGNVTNQNIKMQALLREYVEKLDNLAVSAAVIPASKTVAILHQMANELESEVSIIVGS